MRRLLFIVSALFLHMANAQTQKGYKLVGVYFGSFDLNHYEYKTTYDNSPTMATSTSSSFGFNIGPNILWFVADNIAVGGSVYLSRSSSKQESRSSTDSVIYKSTSRSLSFGLNPWVRFYFGGNEKGKFYADASLSSDVSPSKFHQTSNYGYNYEQKSYTIFSWGAGARLGYELFLNQNIGVSAQIGFQYFNEKSSTDYDPNFSDSYSAEYVQTGWYVPVGVSLQVHLAGSAD